MELSTKGAGFLRVHEGFVEKWYLDPVGIPTIGVGFTWRSAAFRAWWKKNKGNQPFKRGATITRSQADDALRFLVSKEYGKAVNDFLGKPVPQHVFDGMVSPVFNLGPGSLKWKWAAAAKKGDYAASAERLRDTGTTAKGKKLKGLVLRRIEEAELLEFGDYTVGKMPKVVKDPVLKRGQRGQEVRELQMDLTQLHIYDGAIDGIFGYGTEAALMQFQREQDLTVDGYAGPATLKALEAATEGAKIGAKPPKTPKPLPAKPKRGAGGIVALIIAAGAAVWAFLKSQGWI